MPAYYKKSSENSKKSGKYGSQMTEGNILKNFICDSPVSGKPFSIDTNLAIKIITMGVPLGIQSMILTLSNLVVQYYINGFGENDIAAFTIYFKVETLIYLPIMVFGQAMVTFVGQNIGAGKTLQSMVIVIVTLCGFRIALLKTLLVKWHTIQAVAAVYPLTWFCAAVLFTGCWFYYKNKMNFYGLERKKLTEE